ncbi:Integrin alpha-3 [Thelohanellus kitauei]|uniref:Integrin alpha-3 n=1 Tax=Thelohanellus kitauei TaxID=669202 RepID=A0A0C2MZU0_THEKT|nr:Integrin alpha-3 [Thelohanellus kitauei]
MCRKNSMSDKPFFEWIPTLGYVLGSFHATNKKEIILATSDDQLQKGKLFIYDLYDIYADHTIKPTIIENSEWQSFSNFGWKIVQADINNDTYDDLLVTAPTSSWFGHPVVGHVQLFINRKSKTFVDKASIFIRGNLIPNSFFGFNIEVVDDLNGDNVKGLIISRVFDGEVDIYKRTSYMPFAITIKLLQNRILVDKETIPYPADNTPLETSVQICLNSNPIQDLTLKFSFTHSPDSYSFDKNWQLDYVHWPVNTINKKCIDLAIYLRPWFYDTPLTWIFQAEVVPSESQENTNTDEESIIYKRNFFSEIFFEKKCNRICNDNSYTVKIRENTIWFQNSDEFIYFYLKLTNNGDILTHLIIEAGLNFPCDITIFDEKMKNYQLSGLLFQSTKYRIRFLYPKKTKYNEYFDFIVRASCPQILDRKIDLVLELSIQSFFPYAEKHFRFPTNSTFEPEFVVETILIPFKSKMVCRDIEMESTADFNVDIFIRGVNYDDQLVFVATLYFDNTSVTGVTSIRINCKIGM